MKERERRYEVPRPADEKALRLGRFVVFSLRLRANRALSAAFGDLGRLSRRPVDSRGTELMSVQGYAASLSDFAYLRDGPEIWQANKRLRSIIENEPNQQLYLDTSPEAVEVRSTPFGVGVALPLRDESLPAFRQMMTVIGDIDRYALHPIGSPKEERVYASFNVPRDESRQRDLAEVAMRRTLESLADRPRPAASAGAPELVYQERAFRIRPDEAGYSA